MQVDGATAYSAQQTQSGAQTNTNKQDSMQMFMTLLMAQLKAQDPTAPMDPNAMVGQLVQFNTLGEIMKIRQLLESSGTAASKGSAG